MRVEGLGVQSLGFSIRVCHSGGYTIRYHPHLGPRISTALHPKPKLSTRFVRFHALVLGLSPSGELCRKLNRTKPFAKAVKVTENGRF